MYEATDKRGLRAHEYRTRNIAIMIKVQVPSILVNSTKLESIPSAHPDGGLWKRHSNTTRATQNQQLITAIGLNQAASHQAASFSWY